MSAAVTGMRATPTRVDEELKKELITILLKVYMSGRYVSRLIIENVIPSFSPPRNSDPSIDKASRLLNTQAMNFDALEVTRCGSGRARGILLIHMGFRSFQWFHRTGQ